MLDIDKIRSQIPSLDKSIYMNTGGTGPILRSVIDTITETYEAIGTDEACLVYAVAVLNDFQ